MVSTESRVMPLKAVEPFQKTQRYLAGKPVVGESGQPVRLIDGQVLLRGFEIVQEAVFEDINRVEFFRGPKLGPFTADVSHLHCHVLYQLLLDRQVPVLYVGNHTVVSESLQAGFAIRERNGLQRPDAARRQRKYGQSRRNVQILRRYQHSGRARDRQ